MHQVFDTAAEGLAHELSLFEGTAPAVTVWTCRKPSLVCPAAFERRDGFSEAASASARRGWPVVLRKTGGGAVPVAPGVFNICLAYAAPMHFTIADGYESLTRVLRSGLGEAGPRLATGATPGSFCDGDWNLSIDGQKVVGTAQRRRPMKGGGTRVLAHALILVSGDLEAGASAVDGLHRDLGLPPIDPTVHTTLERVFGPASGAKVAGDLLAAAAQEFARSMDREGGQT